MAGAWVTVTTWPRVTEKESSKQKDKHVKSWSALNFIETPFKTETRKAF
jgi:hypothetical protein